MNLTLEQLQLARKGHIANARAEARQAEALEKDILALICTVKPGDILTVPREGCSHVGKKCQVKSVQFDAGHASVDSLGYTIRAQVIKKDGTVSGSQGVYWTVFVRYA